MKELNYLSTLPEIFEWCAVPKSIVERKDLLLDVADRFPGFEKVIELAHTEPTQLMLDTFSDFPAQVPVSKIPNKQTTTFSDFFTKDYYKGLDLPSLERRRTHFCMCMDYLEPRDFAFLLSVFQGKMPDSVNPKINTDVLAMAFPHIFPNL